MICSVMRAGRMCRGQVIRMLCPPLCNLAAGRDAIWPLGTIAARFPVLPFYPSHLCGADCGRVRGLQEDLSDQHHLRTRRGGDADNPRARTRTRRGAPGRTPAASNIIGMPWHATPTWSSPRGFPTRPQAATAKRGGGTGGCWRAAIGRRADYSRSRTGSRERILMRGRGDRKVGSTGRTVHSRSRSRPSGPPHSFFPPPLPFSFVVCWVVATGLSLRFAPRGYTGRGKARGPPPTRPWNALDSFCFPREIGSGGTSGVSQGVNATGRDIIRSPLWHLGFALCQANVRRLAD